jgi:hypothetical protein
MNFCLRIIDNMMFQSVGGSVAGNNEPELERRSGSKIEFGEN